VVQHNTLANILHFAEENITIECTPFLPQSSSTTDIHACNFRPMVHACEKILCLLNNHNIINFMSCSVTKITHSFIKKCKHEYKEYRRKNKAVQLEKKNRKALNYSIQGGRDLCLCHATKSIFGFV